MAGVIFGLTGMAFLTVALWIVIASHESALVAYLVLGALYLLLGFCFLAFGGQKTDAHPADNTANPTQPQSREPILQVVEAFAVGLQAGRAARPPRS
jgi:hypothetical protein